MKPAVPGVATPTGNPDNAQKPDGHSVSESLVRLFPCLGTPLPARSPLEPAIP